jgi:membrane protein DedA with SNARE-associated domain
MSDSVTFAFVAILCTIGCVCSYLLGQWTGHFYAFQDLANRVGGMARLRMLIEQHAVSPPEPSP